MTQPLPPAAVPQPKLATTTADLDPRGLAGYAKSYAPLVGGLCAVLLQFVTSDPWRTILTAIVALCTYAATFYIPNAIKPVLTVPANEAP